jgi:hypothetical protein
MQKILLVDDEEDVEFLAKQRALLHFYFLKMDRMR